MADEAKEAKLHIGPKKVFGETLKPFSLRFMVNRQMEFKNSQIGIFGLNNSEICEQISGETSLIA